MMVFKRKQVVVLSLVLMIIAAGYLQYSYKKSSVAVNNKDTGRLGEAVYVENKDIASKEQVSKDALSIKPTSVSKQGSDFFSQARLDRESLRGKDSEALKGLTNDANASKEVKAKAYDQMMKIVNNSQRELSIETLIKEKGYSDVVALFGEDGSLDIIIKSPNLTSAQVAQVSDIASRHANLAIGKIHIRNTN